MRSGDASGTGRVLFFVAAISLAPILFVVLEIWFSGWVALALTAAALIMCGLVTPSADEGSLGPVRRVRDRDQHRPAA